jgi:hypothetical protein
MCMACALWSGLDRLVFGATIADAGRFVSQIRIPAKEVARRTDLQCVVAGPVERELCVKLFTDPRMQKAFAMWRSIERTLGCKVKYLATLRTVASAGASITVSRACMHRIQKLLDHGQTGSQLL